MNIKFLLALAAPLFVASIFSSCRDKDDDSKDVNKLTSYKDNKEFGEKYLLEKSTEDGVVMTPTGLLFKINTLGTGIRPEDGDTVFAIVTGNKVDGKQNEFRYDTINGPLYGQKAALVEGVKYMTAGSDFDFWSPYYLAYGASSYEGMSREPRTTVTVNPYSAVKFNVKLISVKKED